MNKFYGAHDQWTDLDKENDVLITSTDGVIDSVKVNGEDYGGGSSDVTTAIVTVEPSVNALDNVEGAFLYNTPILEKNIYLIEGVVIEAKNLAYTKTVVLYQGKSYLLNNQSGTAIESVSGNIEYNDDLGIYEITGDCTVVLIRNKAD